MPSQIIQAEAQPTPPSPNIGDNLDYMKRRLDRLAAEIPGTEGTYQFPDWWPQDTEPVNEIPRLLQQEGADLTHVPRYYEQLTRSGDLCRKIYGRERDLFLHPIDQLASNLSVEVVGKAFALEPETGVLHTAVLESIRAKCGEAYGTLDNELKILKTAYNFANVTELLSVHGTGFDAELHDVLRHTKPLEKMQSEDMAPVPDFNYHDTQIAIRGWMNKAVGIIADMSPEEAADYTFSASRNIHPTEAANNFLKVLAAFEHFGKDRLKHISEVTKIYGLDAYSVDQLERMEAFANDPAGMSEKLANHDVIVVFTNRFGDHNGILRNVASEIDDESGRTLFFEISKIGDIFKHMATLKKAGIKPATIVLAAHNAKGQFHVSDNRNPETPQSHIATIATEALVKRTNETGAADPGVTGYSLHNLDDIARLIDEYMQPSRSLDDDENDTGRKKVIFWGCHGATIANVGSIDENSELIKVGEESIMSQFSKSLIKAGIQSSVDVYGAEGGIQTHRTALGIRFSSQVVDFDKGRPPLEAQRIRIEHGTLTQKTVGEIALRKVAD